MDTNLGGVVLGVVGVEGHCWPAGNFREFSDQFFDLGYLVGFVGDPDLRDDQGLTLEHRGKQPDLGVTAGPGAAQDLAVDREGNVSTGGLFAQPGAEGRTKGVHVDLLQ